MTTMNRVISAIKDRNRSQGDLSRFLNIDKRAVWEAVTTLRNIRAIHVASYRRLSNHQEAVFGWGEGKDADPLYKPKAAPVVRLVVDQVFDPVPKLSFWHEHVFAPPHGN